MTYTLVEDELGHANMEYEEWCWSELDGQRDVKCTREKNHDGPHEATVGWPPCSSCEGLDMHQDDCPERESTTNGAVVVQWSNAPADADPTEGR